VISGAYRTRRNDFMPGSLPLVLLAIGGGAVVVCLAAAVLAVFSATIAPRKKAVIPPTVTVPLAAPEPSVVSPEVQAADLQRKISATESTATRLTLAADQVRAKIATLDQQKTELQKLVDQHRTALRQAEETQRQSIAEQKDAAARKQHLLAELADLQKRIAALTVSIADVQRSVQAQIAADNNKPQLVECTGEGLILQPQHVRIPTSQIAAGVLVSSTRSRGAYFLVRPDGFNSFVMARGIVRAAGALVIAEPRLKGE